MNFAAAAEQFWQREFARLSDLVTPRIEALRSLTLSAFRTEIALMASHNRSLARRCCRCTSGHSIRTTRS
jgi:hypothetical protein